MPNSITPTIVVLNTTVTPAPQSSQLQQSGAFVSVGGSTLTSGTYQYCATLAQVQALLSTSGNYVELGDMAATFFAQTSGGAPAVGVYVLELGTQGSASAAITALQTWINANPDEFYAYLLPATWDASGAALNTMTANYSSASGMTYFFASSTSSTISAYAATNKALFVTCPSPTEAGTEFQAAQPFYQFLAQNPNSASPAAPMAYRFAYGVTPWAQVGNATAINAILTAFGNVILTGAEGGLSNACLFKGTTMDGTQAMWWYGIDWVQIQSKQALAAAVINGSNENPPLVFNQHGINKLLGVLQDLGNEAVAAQLVESATFSAIPFADYVKANPNDYKAGRYAGFSCTVVGQNGFLTLTFNVAATQFAA